MSRTEIHLPLPESFSSGLTEDLPLVIASVTTAEAPQCAEAYEAAWSNIEIPKPTNFDENIEAFIGDRRKREVVGQRYIAWIDSNDPRARSVRVLGRVASERAHKSPFAIRQPIVEALTATPDMEGIDAHVALLYVALQRFAGDAALRSAPHVSDLVEALTGISHQSQTIRSLKGVFRTKIEPRELGHAGDKQLALGQKRLRERLGQYPVEQYLARL